MIENIVVVIAILFVYTIISVAWFFLHFGDKFGKDRWYDYILYPPALLIAYLIGLYYRKQK